MTELINSKLSIVFSIILAAAATVVCFAMLERIGDVRISLKNGMETLESFSNSGEKTGYLKNLTQNDMESVDKYFVASGTEGAISFVNEVEEIAKNSGVELTIDNMVNSSSDQKTAVKKQNTSEFKEYLIFDVHVSGSWEGVSKFLSLMENVPKRVSVNEVSLEKIGDMKAGKSMPIWKGSVGFTALKLI